MKYILILLTALLFIGCDPDSISNDTSYTKYIVESAEVEFEIIDRIDNNLIYVQVLHVYKSNNTKSLSTGTNLYVRTDIIPTIQDSYKALIEKRDGWVIKELS